jgi:NAD+ synthase
MTKKKFSKDVLMIDPAAEVERICKKMRYLLGRMLKRRGVVVGVSGGVDSSVTLGLAAMALGPVPRMLVGPN